MNCGSVEKDKPANHSTTVPLRSPDKRTTQRQRVRQRFNKRDAQLTDQDSKLEACLQFSGMLTMGSSFLTVNEGWEKYLEDAERTYRNLEEGVKTRLVNLAIEARNAMENEKWKDDVWLRQLDWTPKVAGKSRGIGISEAVGFFLCFLELR